jgi:hypothetical protein
MALTASAERMDKHLLPYIASVQAVNPDRLLVRGQICNMAADLLSVRRQSVSARIAGAIADEKLIEIFPRADWLVRLPEGDDLPRLFAAPSSAGGALYELMPTAPLSRGAGGVSFLSTPEGLKVLLALTRKRLGLPEPDGMEYHTPVFERRVRPDDYGQMLKVLSRYYPESTDGAHAEDVLREMLSVLRLKPPMQP